MYVTLIMLVAKFAQIFYNRYYYYCLLLRYELLKNVKDYMLYKPRVCNFYMIFRL